MSTLTNDLARLANSANVLVSAITTNGSAITSVSVGGITINSSGYTGDANNATYLGGSNLATIEGHISNAYSNATAYADTKAAAAYANSKAYTDASIAAADNATAAYINAVSYTDTKIGTANTSMIANASAAYSNSVTYVDTKIGTANSAIVANAGAAYTNSVSYTDSAIGTANTAMVANASAAYTNSVSYTDSAIGTANSAITGNAATAYSNAVSYTDTKIGLVNTAISANASAAYTNATTYSSNASNISSGTVAEARLPYRMNQNVRTSDNVEFSQMTLTGNLVVSGNVNIIGANNLSVSDNMIYLNSNNDVTNPDIGIAGNYNDGSYAHTGIFRDASDGIWKVFDNYTPEPDANVYIDTTNTSFHVANFQANTYYGGNTSTNWFISNTSGNYITGTVNAASHTVGSSTIANSSGVYAAVINASSGIYGTLQTTSQPNITANNSSYLGGTAAASYQLNSTLSANVATLTSNNSNYLGTYASSTYPRKSEAATIDGSWNINNNAFIMSAHYYTNMYDATNTYVHYYPSGGNGANNTFANLRTFTGGGGLKVLRFGGDGILTWDGIGSASSDWRAPIFYDNNNTGYYTDPASTSNLYRLTVNQTSSGTNGLLVNMPTGAENTASGIRVYGYSPAIELMDKDSVQNWYMGIDDNDGNKLIFGRGYGPGQSIAQAITVDTSDNIGIGTSSPSTKLHQYGGDFMFESGTSGTGGKIYFKTTDNADLNKWIGQESYWTVIGSHVNEGFRTKNSSGTYYFSAASSGTVTATADFRAPIFYDSNNTSYYVDPASGSSLNSATFYGMITGKTNTGGGVGTSNDSGSMSIRGDGTNGAVISFHRPGAYAINMGLDTDNVFRIGGWSDGSSGYRLQLSGPGGTHTFNGNISASGYIYAPGCIVQVQQTVKTSTSSVAVSANTYNEFDSAFRVSITPKSSSSKIAIMACISGAQSTGTVRYKFQFSTNGGSTWSDVPYQGDANASHGQAHFGYAVNGDGNQVNTCTMELIHSPATTSAITYRVLFGQDVGTTYHFNRSISYPNNFLGATYASTFIVKEIAA